jgi:plastocyanin
VGTTLVVPYVTHAKVTAFDERTGAVRWTFRLPGLGFADPVAVAGAVIVADAAGWVHGLDVATGREVWNATVGEDGGVFGGLSVAEGRLFVPVVRGGFMGDEGGVVAFSADGAAQAANGTGHGSRDGVALRGFQFEPRTLRIGVGQNVTWRNEDPVLHTVTAADGSFDVDVAAGETVQLHFTKKGTFAYYCKPHATQGADGTWQGMTGTLIVE